MVRSKEKRQGLRSPVAKISGRAAPLANGLSAGIGVRLAARRGGIDAQELAEQGVGRLPVPTRRVALSDVGRAAAVAAADVEQAVGAEGERAAVVVRLGLVDREQGARRGCVDHTVVDGVLDDPRVSVGVREVEVEVVTIG